MQQRFIVARGSQQWPKRSKVLIEIQLKGHVRVTTLSCTKTKINLVKLELVEIENSNLNLHYFDEYIVYLYTDIPYNYISVYMHMFMPADSSDKVS